MTFQSFWLFLTVSFLTVSAPFSNLNLISTHFTYSLYGLKHGLFRKNFIVFPVPRNEPDNSKNLKSGDVETNPGPPIIYKDLVSIFNENRKKLNVFHVNCQSLIKKKTTMNEILNYLGTNAIYGLSETKEALVSRRIEEAELCYLCQNSQSKKF